MIEINIDKKEVEGLFEKLKTFEDRLAALYPDDPTVKNIVVDGRKRLHHQIADIEQKDRKLRIAIAGPIKAGKSTFLNSYLFNGKEILPTAATPKTAVLTRIII